MKTEAPVGSRPSRMVHRVDTPSCARRARIASARASVPSLASTATSMSRRAMATAALTAPPPGWVETSSASVLRPSSSNKNELSAFSMVMRSMRSLSMIAMVSMVAPPTVRTFIRRLRKAKAQPEIDFFAYIPYRQLEQSMVQYLYAPVVGALGEFHGPERPEYPSV